MTCTTCHLIVPAGRRLTTGRLYLRLYHGRDHPDQEMDDWGFQGPVFGPLTHVVMTYLQTIRINGVHPDEELWIDTTRDLVQWEGKYYGDFELLVAQKGDTA